MYISPLTTFRTIGRSLAHRRSCPADQRPDQRPFLIREVARIAQLVAAVARAVLGSPHRAPREDDRTRRESHPIPTLQDPAAANRPGRTHKVSGRTLRCGVLPCTQCATGRERRRLLSSPFNPINLETPCRGDNKRWPQTVMSTLDFISLFSGAGGLDFGLEMAGWRCVYACDIDPVAVMTIQANKDNQVYASRQCSLSSASIKEADVRKLSGADILDAIGAQRGSVPLLAGGPPCQSWSSAGHQLGFKDPRGRLWSDFVRIANELDVRWLLFENVRGLLTARGEDGLPGSALQTIRSKLQCRFSDNCRHAQRG